MAVGHDHAAGLVRGTLTAVDEPATEGGVERVRLSDGRSVIFKYATGPYVKEAQVLRHVAAHGVPVPRLLAAAAQGSVAAMVLKAFGLKPWRQDEFKISPDPQLVEKIRDIVALYMSPPVAGWTGSRSAGEGGVCTGNAGT